MKTAPRLKEKGSLYIKNMCMYNLLQMLVFSPSRERRRSKAKYLPDTKITSRWISKLKKKNIIRK